MGKTVKVDPKETAPKGYKNTFDAQQKKRDARREALNKLFNQERKDPF